IQPDGKPRLGRLVIQNNRVAKSIGERALTAAIGYSSEGHTAVGGTRYARELVDCCASGVIKPDTNLVGVIRVSRSERLRLNNVWRGLRPGNQVNIRSAIRVRDWKQFSGKLDQGIGAGG